MGSFISFISGFVAGTMVGFAFCPIFKSPREENLGLAESDKMLRLSGAILYSILLLVFFSLTLFKK